MQWFTEGLRLAGIMLLMFMLWVLFSVIASYHSRRRRTVRVLRV
jgi:hypothetical protein